MAEHICDKCGAQNPNVTLCSVKSLWDATIGYLCPSCRIKLNNELIFNILKQNQKRAIQDYNKLTSWVHDKFNVAK